MFDRRMAPLFDEREYPPPPKASMLTVETCDPWFACQGVAAWHSRLPYAQRGPWRIAFAAHFENTCFGVALWHNPSARMLPQTWLELRRLAVAPDAPHCTASFMLGRMARIIRRTYPDAPMLISYQDTEVHTGTIYRAAGWHPDHYAKPRARNRTKPRRGTRRDYRTNSNGTTPDAAGKVRWHLALQDGDLQRSSQV